ncbi:hypothetical protein E2C01_073279 [Portunus trituberculatus]|uniref:Uncharacterized protein n=1 Tax=Portunus trituberculatus TaxID=210409 RepID=A0A5B7I4S9_PORTR|nr:hypothetical protein [Portunus trituberculatus]
MRRRRTACILSHISSDVVQYPQKPACIEVDYHVVKTKSYLCIRSRRLTEKTNSS